MSLQPLPAYAFGALGLERLTARIHKGNSAWVEFHRAVELRHEGTMRGYILRDGERRDCLVYGRLKE